MSKIRALDFSCSCAQRKKEIQRERKRKREREESDRFVDVGRETSSLASGKGVINNGSIKGLSDLSRASRSSATSDT